MIKDRNGSTVAADDSQERFLSFLYNKAFGRILLKIMCRRAISNVGALYMRSPLSKRRIKKTVEKNGIDMSEYIGRDFGSFNEFFIRKIKDGARPVDFSPESVISPADSKLTVYDISEDSVYKIKGCEYSVEQLIADKEEAKNYNGGKCFVYRLSVDNYHRYCHVDSGREIYRKFIPGALHTVNPIALEKLDVYGKNCRELTVIETENFGRIAFVEVGAMMVGRINNAPRGEIKRGAEKGYFSFGGSTIVVLYRKGCAVPDGDIAGNSAEEIETAVKYGERVGTKPR